MRIAVIGVGLIGGSIGLAARERLEAEVVGWDPDPGSVRLAAERGAVDRVAGGFPDALEGAEAAFVAAPVGVLPAVLGEVLAAAGDRCVVSDVGSTKRIVEALQADQRFVGGHPLAGAETQGVAHARADLFDGATWYLTPSEATSGILYERLHRVIRGLGARPVAIDAREHDTVLALVSHLPHVLANVLINQVGTAFGETQMLPATGPSFRDATRVAGANTAIWADIYLANRDALVTEIDRALAALGDVRDALDAADRDRIVAWNEAAAGRRRSLLDAQASGNELFELRVAVTNRPGIVAEVALALGRASVNIADLALYPTADMSDGVVALWIAGESEAERAQAAIEALKLPVFRP